MNLAKRLSLAMRIKGISQATLGEAVGVSQTTIWKLMNGKTSSNRKLFEIANYLKVSLDWLVNGTGKMDDHQLINNVEYVGKIKEGMIIVKGKAIVNADGTFEIDEDYNGKLIFYSDDPNAFALKVIGDSMFPRINSGEFVIIEPKIEPNPGDEVLVRIKDGCNMIRKLESHRDHTFRFTSINQDHPPVTIDEDLVKAVMFISAIVKSIRYMEILEV